MKLKDITGDLKIYFNWSCNALMPITTGAADIFLKEYKEVITRVSRGLVADINYPTGPLYRGIILREPTEVINPHSNFQYLSFSVNKKVAEHFADVNGFGSNLVNVSQQLGDYGYVIEYCPRPEEILFHYQLLKKLPYAEAFNLIHGIDGEGEVNSLLKQMEVMIVQPRTPFKNVTPFKQTIHNAYK